MSSFDAVLARLRADEEPSLVARMASGWAVMGARQFLSGYCLLLPDPLVSHLDDMPPADQAAFLADMGRLGQAVKRATGAARMNYAIFGNLDPVVHAHVVPRYADEPEELRTGHPWLYDWSAGPAFDPGSHGHLVAKIRDELEKLGL